MPLLSDASGSRRRMRMDREPSAPRAERVCRQVWMGGGGAGGIAQDIALATRVRVKIREEKIGDNIPRDIM